MKPEAPLTVLRGVGPKRAAALAEAGLERVADLLWFLPAGYEALGEVVGTGEVAEGVTVRVAGDLERIRHRRISGRGGLVEAELHDAEGKLDVVWFQPGYFAERLAKSPRVALRGQVKRRGRRLQMSHPEVLSESELEESGYRPRYRPLAGLSARQMGDLVQQVLASDASVIPTEDLPEPLLRRLGLPNLPEALCRLHASPDPLEFAAWLEGRSPFLRRLVFGELCAHQLELARRYQDHRTRGKDRRYEVGERVREVTRQILPFRLTGAQRRVVREMVADLTSPYPMLRLLQGDVGSGKTIVAALIMLVAIENDVSSALLAPTELLAEQHAASLRSLLGARYPISLWTAQSKDTRRSGETGIYVGTHALLEDRVSIPRLGLVVIDEQHRFGVDQRRKMVEKGTDVDLLVMSATPIPRTLALSSHGDLDLSVLDELPPGRVPVETLVVPKGQRKDVYRRLRAELRGGAQGYVVFPAIGPSDTPGLVSLEKMAPKIEAGLEGVATARFHGQMPWEERWTLMERFRRGEIQLLLATSVVEVGVDVAAASALIIEGAERFGLAQLHQLRGRVGRGETPSWCAAIHGRLTSFAELRLEAFGEHQDGFAIAERDLAIRGEGELLGQRQAGMIEFRFADLERDADLQVEARRYARGRIEGDDRVMGGSSWFES